MKSSETLAWGTMWVPAVMKALMTALVGEKLKSPSKVAPGAEFVAGLENNRLTFGGKTTTNVAVLVVPPETAWMSTVTVPAMSGKGVKEIVPLVMAE